jgi:hypothetical protein
MRSRNLGYYDVEQTIFESGIVSPSGDRKSSFGRWILDSCLTEPSPRALNSEEVDRAIALGLAAWADRWLQYGCVHAAPKDIERVHVAATAAAMVGRQLHSRLERLLLRTFQTGIKVCLLKGVGTEEWLYPGPGFRPLGDIDLLVSEDQRAAFEAILSQESFVQRSESPDSVFETCHHSMPFWHPADHCWIEVHTRLFPDIADFLRRRQTSLSYGTAPAYQLEGEAQTLYTAAHWAVSFPRRRGLVQLLDFALLVERIGIPTLNRVEIPNEHAEWFDRALAVASELLELPYLGPTPATAERLRRAILVSLGTHYIVDGKDADFMRTEEMLFVWWRDLMNTRDPALAVAKVPYRYFFPHGIRRHLPDRLSKRLAKLSSQ